MYSDEDYEMLKESLTNAYKVCPPDEYQKRHNDLIKCIGKIMIAPYQTKECKKDYEIAKKELNEYEKPR